MTSLVGCRGGRGCRFKAVHSCAKKNAERGAFFCWLIALKGSLRTTRRVFSSGSETLGIRAPVAPQFRLAPDISIRSRSEGMRVQPFHYLSLYIRACSHLVCLREADPGRLISVMVKGIKHSLSHISRWSLIWASDEELPLALPEDGKISVAVGSC